MLKYLRIAVTALSLTACVLLVALWVRSYWWADAALGGYSTFLYKFDSHHGGLEFLVFDPIEPEVQVLPNWDLDSSRIKRPNKFQVSEGPRIFSYLGMGWRFAPGGLLVFFPHWTLVVLSATLAAFPWLKWSRRFSLRALLIAFTLVAVGLGIIVLA